jgi:hypothetical protein
MKKIFWIGLVALWNVSVAIAAEKNLCDLPRVKFIEKGKIELGNASPDVTTPQADKSYFFSNKGGLTARKEDLRVIYDNKERPSTVTYSLYSDVDDALVYENKYQLDYTENGRCFVSTFQDILNKRPEVNLKLCRELDKELDKVKACAAGAEEKINNILTQYKRNKQENVYAKYQFERAYNTIVKAGIEIGRCQATEVLKDSYNEKSILPMDTSSASPATPAPKAVK